MRQRASLPSPADGSVIGEAPPDAVKRQEFFQQTRDRLMDVFRDNSNVWLPVSELAKKRKLTTNMAMSVIKKYYNTFEIDRKTDGDVRIVSVRVSTAITRYWP